MLRHVTVSPPDPIFGVGALFNASKVANKQSLALGVYRGNDGKPFIFDAVAKAEDRLIHKVAKEYLPMSGHPGFNEEARKLLWNPLWSQMKDRSSVVQAVAGTGGIYVALRFIKEYFNCPVLIGYPTWVNYESICENVGLYIRKYNYMDGLKFNHAGVIQELEQLPEHSCFIMQPVGHNPTGTDPTMEQAEEIYKVCVKKNHIILFDFAYPGYASGNLEKDMDVVRAYAKYGKPFFVSMSYSKIMGMYGERIGALHIIVDDPKTLEAVTSQAVRFTRGCVSVPPQNGALIAHTIMSSPDLRENWLNELSQCAKRVLNMRNMFVDQLNQKTGRDWEFLRKQRGMFALTGLSPEQSTRLGDLGIFIPGSGRVSIPALTTNNIDFVTDQFAKLIRE